MEVQNDEIGIEKPCNYVFHEIKDFKEKEEIPEDFEIPEELIEIHEIKEIRNIPFVPKKVNRDDEEVVIKFEGECNEKNIPKEEDICQKSNGDNTEKIQEEEEEEIEAEESHNCEGNGEVVIGTVDTQFLFEE